MTYQFFDKEGNNFNLISDENDILTGSLFFTSTSVHIPSVEHIYILNNNEPVNVNVSLEKNSVFKTFGRQDTNIIEDINQFNGQVNIYLESETEGFYTDVLNIYFNNELIAKIDIECEVIGHEERFETLLETLYNPDLLPNKSYYHIFRDANVKELNIDYKILNTKQKELLMLGYDIFPYIGADKALVNMITYFGYNDVDIKEIWRNTTEKNKGLLKYNKNEYQNYKQTGQIPLTTVNTSEWEKTNRFGLFYKFNRVTNDEDAFGVPLTEEVFNYSLEEILIKFKKLKDFLNEKFLPLNTKLHSITGEGIFFEHINVNVFNEHTFIQSYSDDFNIEIKIDKYDYYLENLEFYNDYQPYEIDKNLPIQIYSNKKVALADKSTVLSVYDNHKDVNLGARVILNMKNLRDKVKDLKFSMKNISNVFPNMKWKNLQFGNYYEIEWVLTNLTNGYVYSKRGSIQEYFNHIAILSHIGEYKVELFVWDLENNRHYVKLDKNITVKMSQPLLNYLYPNTKTINKLSEVLQFKLKYLVGPLKNLLKTNTKVKNFNVKVDTFNIISYLNDDNFEDSSAEIISFDKEKNIIGLTNINGDISKIKNTNVIARNKKKYNVLEIPLKVDVINKTNILFDTNDTNLDAIENNKYLRVPIYKKIELLDDDYDLTFTDKYYLNAEMFSYLSRMKVEYIEEGELKSKYFYCENFTQLNEYKFSTEIDKEIYEILLDNPTVRLFNITNIYSTYLLGINNGMTVMFYDFPNSDTDWYDYVSDFTPFNIDSGSSNDVNEIYDIYFDIVSFENDIILKTNELEELDNRIRIDKFSNLDFISTNTKLYWTNLDVNIIKTIDNSRFILEDYLVNINDDKVFTFTAANDIYEDTYFTLNNIKYEFVNLPNYNPETLVNYLNSLDLPFYFIIEPNVNISYNILGIKKYNNDNIEYYIECFNDLYIDNKLSKTISNKNFTQFSLDKLEIFNSSTDINRGTTIFFTFDESKILGMSNFEVNIYNKDLHIFKTMRNNFTYTFTDAGIYTFTFSIKDNIGNRIEKTLNNFIHVE